MFSEIYVIGKGVVAKSAQKIASEFFSKKAIKLDENTTASTLLLAQHKLAITSLNQALKNL